MSIKNIEVTAKTLAVFLISIFAAVSSAAKENDASVYLETRISRDKVTEGENIVYEVVLFTPTPSVDGIELASFPDFEGIEVSRSAPDSKLTPVEIKGQPYYTAVVDRYFLRFPSKGKFSIKGASYNLGLYRQQEYYDPFWGRSIGNVIDKVALVAPDVSVRVAALPERGKPSSFSGAVGDFEISAAFADESLRSGEDALLTVTISGAGNLNGVTLPDIPSSLPDGIQFKSMTDTLSHYIKDGELGSEVEIECVVMPKREGTFVLDSLHFNFYNTATGKYETVTAPSVEIEVGSGLPGSGKPPVIMEI